MNEVEIKNLSIGYDNNPILKNINFTIEKGDYIVVIGENGAGKSTLIKTILGLIPKISGEIIFNNKKHHIAYLPQQVELQKEFPISCYEIVLSGFEAKKGFRPFFTKKEKEEALLNMKKLNVDKYAKKNIYELSGGEKQKVLLARALCATNEMIFLDEPVSGLDIHATAEMYTTIKKINEENITIVMISHDVNSFDDATKVLYVGREVYLKSKADYLKENTFMGRGE